MKKAMTMLAFVLVTSFAAKAQQTKQFTGLFEGFDGTVYSFSDLDEAYTIFDSCDEKVLSEYDLQSEDYLYETFKVSYVVSENSDGDNVLKITGLELIPTEDED